MGLDNCAFKEIGDKSFPFEAICSYGARPILREGRERGKVQVISYDLLAIGTTTETYVYKKPCVLAELINLLSSGRQTSINLFSYLPGKTSFFNVRSVSPRQFPLTTLPSNPKECASGGIIVYKITAAFRMNSSSRHQDRQRAYWT
ncbi:unnamed protein product [Cochlearia groenlandica]